MSDLDGNIEYIDAYFKNQLDRAEKLQFEQRCLDDQIFANQVALFVTAEEGIRQKLLKQKKQEWSGNNQEASVSRSNKIVFIKWLPYVAAACLLLAVTSYFIFKKETPQRLASNYIKENLTLLSQTMNASQDSLQKGIAAYNDRDYNKALQIFEKIHQSYPENVTAKKFTGLVYLITKDYDKALQQFDELATMKDLYRNPGLFFKAVTLLARDAEEDKEEAKRLLERVVGEKLEGSREAEKWLKEWQKSE